MVLTSYQSGLLQAKAYRLLKSRVNKALAIYNLTMAEWALLGQLFDQPEGLRLSDLATILTVEPPLVTNLVDGIEKRGLARRQADATDRRAKRISLTQDGHKLVKEVETQMRQTMKDLLAGVKLEDLLAYLRVLETICTRATA